VIHPHTGKKVFNESLGITEIALQKKKSWFYLKNEYNYSKKVIVEVEKYPDAVIYSQGFAVWSGIKKVANRIIVNPHGLEFYQAHSRAAQIKATRFQAIFNRIFKHSAKVISLGGRLTNLLHRHIENSAQKVVVIPNAVSPPQENFPREFHKHPMQFLFVGRYAANKGIHVLLQAIQELNKEGYKEIFKFNLVGKGPLFEYYTKTYQASNLNYLGFADDEKLIQLYKENDAFVLPTLFEGMPTVVLEAMSYGMPIIVTDTGATTELVNKENGIIINKEDYRSLKNAMTTLYGLDDAVKQKMSDASFKKVIEKFTWQKVARQHIELFKSLQRTMN
jgi:glycosyltransferase involved in cell wall biosynthesis